MTDRVWRERGLRDAVAAGDEAAWRTWYAAEYAPLEVFVLWRCGQVRDLADDALQDTWMTAIRKVRRFDPNVGSFHDWLCGIAANAIRNLLRSRRRRTARHESLNGTEKAADRAKGMAIAEALAGLSERSERVLRMKYLEGHTVAEIAEIWGETEKAVESLLSRARASFREAYGDLETKQ